MPFQHSICQKNPYYFKLAHRFNYKLWHIYLITVFDLISALCAYKNMKTGCAWKTQY